MKKRRWLLFFAWVFITIFLCVQDGYGSGALSSFIAEKIYTHVSFFRSNFLFDDFHHLIRKFAHFSTHFVLALLCYRAVQTGRKKSFATFMLALMFSICLAAFDEFIQIFATDRGARFLDFTINMIGAIFGTIFGKITFRKNTL